MRALRGSPLAVPVEGPQPSRVDEVARASIWGEAGADSLRARVWRLIESNRRGQAWRSGELAGPLLGQPRAAGALARSCAAHPLLLRAADRCRENAKASKSRISVGAESRSWVTRNRVGTERRCGRRCRTGPQRWCLPASGRSASCS